MATAAAQRVVQRLKARTLVPPRRRYLPMSPTIHLVRHAEGPHNLRGGDLTRDPGLTAKGLEQCTRLRETFPKMERVTHIVSSPLRRCIMTSINSFAPVLARGARLQLMPQIQETGSRPSAFGSPVEDLVKEFGEDLDTALMEPGWMEKDSGGKYAPDMAATKFRAREARIILRHMAQQSGPDDDIVVVTHCMMAHILSQDFSYLGYGWVNSGYRSFQFRDLNGQDDEAALFEVVDSPGLVGQWPTVFGNQAAAHTV